MSTPVFRDHFSGHAGDYSRFRPLYPDSLFAWLAQLVAADGQAAGAQVWDCATGNGQAAVALSRHFPRVIATDASAEQIAAAKSQPGVTYAVRPASRSGLEPGSIDLVTIAQALHWIEPEPLQRELRRVLKPGGVVAAWCYELFSISPEVDAPMLELYHDILADDWPEQRRHIETGYQHIDWPWPRLQTPTFEMESNWTLEQTVGYLRTWSATRRWQARNGNDPVALVEERLRAAWGDAAQRCARWPLKLLVSRVAS